MTGFLLDANAVIAAGVAEHVHHDRVNSWLATVGKVALCPIVEGAFVRYLTRTGASTVGLRDVIRAVYDDPRFTLWPDDLSYADVDLAHVIGHRQITDAYLAALAVHHGGRLATLDRALSAALPESAFLIPE